MSRRRRRDDENVGDILSEDEERNQEERLSNASESDVGSNDLYVSDSESLEEEARQSSDDEAEDQVTDPQQQQPSVKQEKVVDGDSQKKDDSKLERESGDGKEQSDTEPHKDEVEGEQGSDKSKDADKEEDDPSFIPTKGAFFQHDLRSDNQPKGRGRDRRIWDKDPVKWKHDMFVMEEQMPKSRDMLISNYGYDIRERPLDAPPPSDRRPRGRGRGDFRGRGRGRPHDTRRNQQRAEYSHENLVYKENYPDLKSGGDQNSGIKVKGKSYYNRNTNKPPPQEPDDHNESVHENEGANQEVDDEGGKPSSSNKVNKQEGDENLSDLLQVINKRENAPSSKEAASTAPFNSRRSEGPPKNFQHGTTFSNYQEAPKPRRYSSLRQRQTSSPVEKRQSQYSPRPRDNRYANFSRPVQPTHSVNFTKKPNGPSDTMKKSENQTIPDEPKYPALPTQTTIQQSSVTQPSPSSIPQAPVANQQPLAYSDPSIASMGTPLDHGLMQMPQMPFQYNPMLNSMHDAAVYQRMMRMVSQQMLQMNMSMEQLPQLPASLPHAMDAAGAAIPPDPQSLPHPTDMQMNPLIPPVSQTLSQGSLGSVMRPPPPPLNPATYFTGPMGMNMTNPQQPFPYPPNLVAQQVGGVTYFNTPTQSPPVQPAPNQSSPRRNAAIPIMAPTGFGIPGIIE